MNQQVGPVLRKQAHDSGDGQTIYHCPFCGSGQVLARSDRTIECQYCSQCFTVQVQPQFPAFPQTINGQPVQVPGMPGEIGEGMPPGGDPNAPVDPSQMSDDGSVPPGADGQQPPPGGDDSGDDSGDDDDSDDAPPWVSKQSVYVTHEGKALDPVNYAFYLAIRNAPDRRAMAGVVKEARRS